MLSDLEIAQKAKLKPIREIANELGVQEDELELYGNYKAKVDLGILGRLAKRKRGKYIDVTAITPTPLGEGKTVTTIGLSQGLAAIGKNVCTCIRQPSLGPVFGIKGGAAGGGYSQVVPMEDFNLHLTGDIHAVGLANNLACAFVDNHIYHGNPLNIDPYAPSLRRVLDISDRWALDDVITGLGSGIVRRTGFDIAVASEVMAILGLTTGLEDIRERLGRMIAAYTRDGKPVTCEDLKVGGAMAVLMKDAIKPNLMQTLEHTPCFVHAGPFANIAHGNSSILADMIATRLAEYTVTESGFGADIGMEKFMNIKCRASGLVPDCVVLVATVRALKMHSGKFRVVAGKPLDPGLLKENPDVVAEGCCNLERHIENARLFGVPVVVAINRFTTDTESEFNVIVEKAKAAGAGWVTHSNVWAEGGKGGAELAEAVVEACEAPKKFRFLYELDWPIKKKIETIATRMYGAGRVTYEKEAEQAIERYTRLGFDKLPICMAKTHLSLTHDPAVKGAPSGYVFPVRDVRASVGAGFLYPLCGMMRTMPGLPTTPAGEKVDVGPDGRIVGLF
ncbi:MAG TPA: formate--tetrahydrofolate ligase [Phycisphaerae bacterium]|nr:formate--tetrahydrofolate ligase [Phycisphaerae bacterium]